MNGYNYEGRAVKWALKSKTVILNAATVLLGIMALPEVADLIDLLPPDWQPVPLIIAGLLNIVVRFSTSTPIALDPAKVSK